MPAESERQRRMMCAEAHHPGSTKARGISHEDAMDYCKDKHPANPGVEQGYATEHESDIDLGREKKMTDAEEPLKAPEMGHGQGQTST